MLDMGFIPDIRKIVAKLPSKRQTLFFSATMPPDIRQLADTLLKDPITVKVASKSAAADTVEQSVFMVEQRYKPYLLQHVITQVAASRTLVFTRTKHGADKVAKQLSRVGIRSEALHGDKSQSARQKALASFKSQHPPVLVATDVAARGLDIDEVSHVINYDVPNIAETYIHRIGRTGRAGATGIAISFCCAGERADLKAIERLIRQTIRIDTNQPAYKLPDPLPGTGGNGQHAAGERPTGQRASGQRAGSGGQRPSGRPGGNGSRRVRVDGNSTSPVGQARQFSGRGKRPKRRGSALGSC
jgi:ATP-dependent RNA helicase RhlE